MYNVQIIPFEKQNSKVYQGFFSENHGCGFAP